MELTKGIKHFVTFIENKVVDIFQVQWSVADQSLETTWSCDDNMRWVLLQCFLVLVDWHTTEKYSNLKERQCYQAAYIESIWTKRCVDPWYGRVHTWRFSMYFENLWYSFEIWKASSRVWHMTNTWGPPELSAFSLSNCCNVAKTKTAVLPIPDLAWQTTSIPVTAWGIHSFWT